MSDASDIFEGRYRLRALIGAGGFAKVYQATQIDIDREVALKVLNITGPQDSDSASKLVARFEQEARLLSQLRDPHTITLYDFGRSRDGHLYMVFEFIDGMSLKQLVQRDGPLSWERCATILDQILQSLEEAHAIGMLHRDIKPGNIMVYDHIGRTDRVKLLDFGIAKMLGNAHSTEDLTSEGLLIGTPRYMSPEQFRGRTLGPPTDIYSLGLVCFEMMTGKPPVVTDDTFEIMAQHVDGKDFCLPEALHIPKALRDVIDRMLRKDPKQRYPTVGDALHDLRLWEATRSTPLGLTALSGSHTARLSEVFHNGESLEMSTRGQAGQRESSFALDKGDTSSVEMPANLTTLSSRSRHRGRLVVVGGVILAAAISLFLLWPAASTNEPQATEKTIAHTSVGRGSSDSNSLSERSLEPPSPLRGETDPPDGPSDRGGQATELVDTVNSNKLLISIEASIEDGPASIKVGDFFVGQAPVKVDLARFKLPVDVVAYLPDGRQAAKTVDSPQEMVYFDDGDFVKAPSRPASTKTRDGGPKTAASNETKSKQRPRSRKRELRKKPTPEKSETIPRESSPPTQDAPRVNILKLE